MESFNTKGTCARQIIYDVKDDRVTDVKFAGGCSGNLKGISKLVIGRNVDEVIEIFRGITCKNGTSCPDQLSLALMDYKAKQAAKS